MLKRTDQRSIAAGERRTVRLSLYSLPGVILATTVYSALHVGARLLASGNLGEDDPLEAIHTQTLQLGYHANQPALYDWVLWLTEQISGPSALGFQLIKYGLLIATCGFVFAAARRVMRGDGLWAFLAVEALALIYQISWRFHEGFTHQVVAMAAVAASFWALTRLLQRGAPSPSWRGGTADFALLGLFIGLGLLSERIFWVFATSLFLAALVQPAARRILLRPALALTVAIAAVCATPYVFWLLSEPGRLSAALLTLHFPAPSEAAQALRGVRRGFTEPVMYLAPLIFILPLSFPRFLPQLIGQWRMPERRTGQGHAEHLDTPDLEKLIAHMSLFNVVALLIGAALFGVWRYPTHALMPLFLITTIWLSAQARHAARNAREVRRFVMLALGIAIVAFFGRLANMYVLDPVCNICRWGIPYRELAGAIRSQGFSAGEVVVADAELGGNLRRYFPKARIVLTGAEAYTPPPKTMLATAQRILVWSSDEPQKRRFAEFHGLLPRLERKAFAEAPEIAVAWRHHYWKPDGYRYSRWHVLLVGSSGE